MEWSHDFCLACDRQTDGSVYCGEACRLAEYEKANSGSEASSPASQHNAFSWPSPSTTTTTTNTLSSSRPFSLAPAYDFAAAFRRSSSRPQSSPATLSRPVLTPSSSQSSLFSMRSNSSTASTESASGVQLSEEARRELRAYASFFDQSRYSRRQSQ